MAAIRFHRLKEMTGLSRTTIWRLESQGKFPQRRRLTRNTVAWIEEEVLDWLESLEVGFGRAPGGAQSSSVPRDPEISR
jgi:prophage regulatory protein